MIDYRELLRKYIRYVVTEEGTAFLAPHFDPPDSFFPSWMTRDGFSEEEWLELNLLDRLP